MSNKCVYYPNLMHNNVKKQFIRALLLINEHYRDIYIKHYRFI